MKKFKKGTLAAITLSVGLLSSASFAAPYTVKPGDSFWKIGRKFGVSIERMLKANNANEKTIIYPGQVLEVPKEGISNEKIKKKEIKNKEIKNKEIKNKGKGAKDCIVYTIKSGDSLWKLSRKYGVSMKNIINANNWVDENTILYVGQTIKIPTNGSVSRGAYKNKGSKKVADTKYGEYLHWFDEVNDLIPRGSVFKVTDFYTGKSFMVKRTMGSYHADVETLTVDDTNMLKEIWGGFSWVRRPAIAEYNGRRIACSVTAMPHAGNDKDAGGVYTSWRSGGYGPGRNLDYIKGNGMDGHIDIHFYGSKRHKDGKPDPNHQECIKKAAGLLK